ncbi:MAG: endonuclease/exonuclease/phosphatase family protein [Actinobacteria bacterium]|nr:endonuclease/exonuclease/phosphatase family protein [Actinomycetota bacterium]
MTDRVKSLGARRIAAILVVVPFAVFAAIRLLGLDFFWPLIPAMAFTPWVALGSVAALLAALALRAWPAAVAALVTVLVFALVLIGRALPDDQPTASGHEITVVSHNMLAGGADAGQLMRLVRRSNADLLALQEMTPEAVASLRAHGLETQLPYYIDESRWAVAGAGLWSRAPLARTDRERDPQRWPAPEAIVAKLGVQIRSLHPNPPMRPSTSATWKRELEELPATPGTSDLPRILVGDYNATLDNRQLREVLDRGYVDAADVTGNGFRFTWPNGRVTLTIDHLLVDRRVRVLDYSTARIDGSDHLALIVRLRLADGA